MKILIALVFMLMVNVLLFTSQTAVDSIALEVGEANPSHFFNYAGSQMEQWDSASGAYTVEEDMTDTLPSAQTPIEAVITVFEDIFNTFRSWVMQTTGAKYFLGIVNAVPNFLQSIGLPPELGFSLGVLWHATTLFLFILFLRGVV